MGTASAASSADLVGQTYAVDLTNASSTLTEAKAGRGQP
jgi:hypothetical protein